MFTIEKQPIIVINKIIVGLQSKVARDDIEQVIDEFIILLAVCRDRLPSASNDVRALRTELLLLSAKLSDIEKRNRQGIVDIANYNISKNQIRMGVIYLLDNIQKYDDFYFFLEEREEENAWAFVEKENTIAAYEDYFVRYPKGKYITQTGRIISELKSDLKRKAAEEKERRKVLKNINFDNRKRKAGQSPEANAIITNLMEWWESIPSNWQKVLATEVGLIGKAKEKNIQRILRLKIIDLSNQQQIQNLAPIRHLTNLRTVNLFKSGVQTLEGIETLANLEEINIANTRINNLKPLLRLKKIRSLVHSGIPLLEMEAFRKIHSNCQILEHY